MQRDQPEEMIMQRISIIGPSGAGKSTLAAELGRRTGLPVCHIDSLHWKPGWVESTKEETRNKVEGVAEGDAWIIDGNYSASLDMRMNRADTVIFLDFPRRIYLIRVLRRMLRHYGRTRPDMGVDCPERFDWEFILWVWNFRKRSRSPLLDALDRHRGKFALYVLSSPREVREFLQSIERSGS